MTEYRDSVAAARVASFSDAEVVIQDGSRVRIVRVIDALPVEARPYALARLLAESTLPELRSAVSMLSVDRFRELADALVLVET